MNKSDTRWANILCHEDMTPFRMIVTDGKMTSTIPVENTQLKTLKRIAYELYGVRPGNILVSQIFDHDSKHS
jgi:hypothetical protein